MKYLIVTSIILISLFSGCIDAVSSQEFQYKDGSSFTLYNDHTFTIHFNKNNKDFSGFYRTDRDTLYLVYPSGYTETLKKNGSDWIDKDGWEWK